MVLTQDAPLARLMVITPISALNSHFPRVVYFICTSRRALGLHLCLPTTQGNLWSAPPRGKLPAAALKVRQVPGEPSEMPDSLSHRDKKFSLWAPAAPLTEARGPHRSCRPVGAQVLCPMKLHDDDVILLNPFYLGFTPRCVDLAKS